MKLMIRMAVTVSVKVGLSGVLSHKHKQLRLLTHVGFLRQNGLILSEVFLYMERSKNQEKKYIITVQKKFHLPEKV